MTPRRAARATAALAAALALAGCPFKPRNPVPSPLEGDWAAARDAATRRVQLYDGLEHRATATATHLGLPEREARARRMGAWLGWTAAELDAHLAQERAEAEAGEEFLVALYTAKRLDNDLDSPATIWHLAVRTPGGEVTALRAQAIDADATIAELFPYVGVFDTVYRVRFPRLPDGPLSGRPFVLELASALGKLDLDFGKADGATRPLEPLSP